MAKKKRKKLGNPPLASTFEDGLVIHPRLPIHDGIFHLGPNVLIASHAPHRHVAERCRHRELIRLNGR